MNDQQQKSVWYETILNADMQIGASDRHYQVAIRSILSRNIFKLTLSYHFMFWRLKSNRHPHLYSVRNALIDIHDKKNNDDSVREQYFWKHQRLCTNDYW